MGRCRDRGNPALLACQREHNLLFALVPNLHGYALKQEDRQMNPKRKFSPKDHAQAGAGWSTSSPVSTPGPLFDLPTVEGSQQVVFMQLTTGFHAREERPGELDVRTVFEVLESVYEPRRRFWRELESNSVLEAINRYSPDLRSALERTENGSYMQLVWRIEEGMFMLQALERCAERLLDTASASRPQSVAGTYQWLHAELLRRGEFFLLSSLESAGKSGVAHIQRMVTTLAGSPVVSPASEPGRPRQRQRRQRAA
jgi:hypothetical protein